MIVAAQVANTTTRAGLTIRAELDRGTYPTGIKITSGVGHTMMRRVNTSMTISTQ